LRTAATLDDSAKDSIKEHSWKEILEDRGGHAHRRSRIPRFLHMSNGAAAEATAPQMRAMT
jgi:hypothetical protein